MIHDFHVGVHDFMIKLDMDSVNEALVVADQKQCVLGTAGECVMQKLDPFFAFRNPAADVLIRTCAEYSVSPNVVCAGMLRSHPLGISDLLPAYARF